MYSTLNIYVYALTAMCFYTSQQLLPVRNYLAIVVITKAPRVCCSVPILITLHRRPVKYRIYLFKNIHCNFHNPKWQPTCLSRWLSLGTEMFETSTLYTFQYIFLSPVHVNGWIGSFFIAGPTPWSASPVPIRNAQTMLTFRILLKCYLYDHLYI